ncbi:MAG: hypothetical protein HY954_00320 [Deltaproteobacteria bacterium]|nr:hypothetical protein [Deltaproteobacteria bacterium]
MIKTRVLLIPVILLLFAASVWAEVMPQLVTDPRQAFVTGSIVVKGEAAADRNLPSGQRRLMALRGAKVVAFREIAEIIDGVAVSGETTVVNMAAESDTVRSTVQGLIKGAQIVKEGYDPLGETAYVYLSVPLTGPNGLIGQLLPQVMPIVPPPGLPMFQPPAQTVPARHDGLIIDVRAQPFKPALMNRIVTKKGEVIYDPAWVAQDILVDRGAAEYTNDIGKAKALLGERGSTNPLVVKAGGVVRSTDVEIPSEDASAVFSSNQANNFLESAKVVFVLR